VGRGAAAGDERDGRVSSVYPGFWADGKVLWGGRREGGREGVKFDGRSTLMWSERAVQRAGNTFLTCTSPSIPSSLPPSHPCSGKTFTMEGAGGGKVVPAAAAIEKEDGVVDEAMMEEGVGGDAAAPSSSSSSSSTDDLPSAAGVNPRALAELFRLKVEKEERGLATVNVSVSMVEIYNENVRDLLASPPTLPPLPLGVDKTKDKGYQAALAARRQWQPPSLEIKHQQLAPPPAAATASSSSSSSSNGNGSVGSSSSSSSSAGGQKKGSSSSGSVGSTKSGNSKSSTNSSTSNKSTSTSTSTSSNKSNSTSSSSSSSSSTGASGVAGGGVYLPGAVSRPVERVEDVTKIMRMGQRHRTVAATKANQASSRSHSLLLVSVQTKDATTGIVSTGRLILVDLAGSERLSKVCVGSTPSPPPPSLILPF